MCDVDLDERYPVKGEVRFRESTREWILEIDYVINDTGGTSRHTCPESTKPEDVPGLISTYEKIDALEARVRQLEQELRRKSEEADYSRRKAVRYKRRWLNG